jgi:hypothetical protein
MRKNTTLAVSVKSTDPLIYIKLEFNILRHLTTVLRHLTVGEIRATFNVNIATFNGK